MILSDQFQRIISALPILQGAEAGLIQSFQQSAFQTHIPAGKDVFVEGDEVEAIALLISGVVRVYKIGDMAGIIVAIVGALPLVAGLFDFCVFTPLFGAPLSGPKIRAAK